MPTAVIVDYQSDWPDRVQQLLDEVKAALSPLAYSDRFVYEHIGSTAVPGLAAKPFIDLQVRMPSLTIGHVRRSCVSGAWTRLSPGLS